MASYNLKLVRDSSRINDLSQNIELLAKDSKITAKQALLQLASPVINRAILENPDSTIFDLKHYSGVTVNGLLQIIYNGEITDTCEEFKDEILQLAAELEINVHVQPLTTDQKIKIEAPKVPEPAEKDEDPGLFKLKDGKFSCGLCFKTFNSQSTGKRHYQTQHMINKDAKIIECRAPNCDKKFAVEHYMKEHMRLKHGISAKMLKSAKKAPKKSIKQETIEP